MIEVTYCFLRTWKESLLSSRHDTSEVQQHVHGVRRDLAIPGGENSISDMLIYGSIACHRNRLIAANDRWVCEIKTSIVCMYCTTLRTSIWSVSQCAGEGRHATQVAEQIGEQYMYLDSALSEGSVNETVPFFEPDARRPVWVKSHIHCRCMTNAQTGWGERLCSCTSIPAGCFLPRAPSNCLCLGARGGVLRKVEMQRRTYDSVVFGSCVKLQNPGTIITGNLQ